MIYRRALLAAAVTAGVVVTAPTGAAAAPAVAAAPPGPSVTLLTGDRVTLGGTDGAKVRPAQGREHVTFYLRSDAQGDTHVVPEDAVVPLSQGRLDPRLFDVSELARTGYDDASRDRLPLIATTPAPRPVRRALRSAGSCRP